MFCNINFRGFLYSLFILKRWPLFFVRYFKATMDGVEWWMSVDEYVSLDYPQKKERDLAKL